jgi:hypothetical protein
VGRASDHDTVGRECRGQRRGTCGEPRRGREIAATLGKGRQVHHDADDLHAIGRRFLANAKRLVQGVGAAVEIAGAYAGGPEVEERVGVGRRLRRHLRREISSRLEHGQRACVVAALGGDDGQVDGTRQDLHRVDRQAASGLELGAEVPLGRGEVAALGGDDAEVQVMGARDLILGDTPGAVQRFDQPELAFALGQAALLHEQRPPVRGVREAIGMHGWKSVQNGGPLVEPPLRLSEISGAAGGERQPIQAGDFRSRPGRQHARQVQRPLVRAAALRQRSELALEAGEAVERADHGRTRRTLALEHGHGVAPGLPGGLALLSGGRGARETFERIAFKQHQATLGRLRARLAVRGARGGGVPGRELGAGRPEGEPHRQRGVGIPSRPQRELAPHTRGLRMLAALRMAQGARVIDLHLGHEGGRHDERPRAPAQIGRLRPAPTNERQPDALHPDGVLRLDLGPVADARNGAVARRRGSRRRPMRQGIAHAQTGVRGARARPTNRLHHDAPCCDGRRLSGRTSEGRKHDSEGQRRSAEHVDCGDPHPDTTTEPRAPGRTTPGLWKRHLSSGAVASYEGRNPTLLPRGRTWQTRHAEVSCRPTGDEGERLRRVPPESER